MCSPLDASTRAGALAQDFGCGLPVLRASQLWFSPAELAEANGFHVPLLSSERQLSPK